MVNGDGESLLLTIRDHGGGFAPEMLMQIGKPYQSSKGRPGGGLGLFLVVNVVRKFGGRVSARNHPNGGAERSEEHTSELQSLMRISYAVFCLKKKKKNNT